MSSGASPVDRRTQLRFSLPARKQQPQTNQTPSDPFKLLKKSNALINSALRRAQSTPNAHQSMSPGLSRAIIMPTNPFV
jgi:hypothetical protein